MKGINIRKEQNINKVEILKEVLNPDYIYIPYNNEEILCTKDVLIGTQVIKDKYSSISGHILGIVNLNNKQYLMIENNFKEEIVKPTIKDKLELLKNTKYYNLLQDKKVLYITSIDEDPYCFNNYQILKQYPDEIVTILDELINILNLKQVIFLMEDDYNEQIELYQETLDNKKINIKVIHNEYPIGNKNILKTSLKLNNYEELITLEELINIYYEVIRRKKYGLKFVTLNGNVLSKTLVLKTKEYSRLNDFLKYIKLNNEYEIIENNSLCGNIIKDTIINEDTNLFIYNKEEINKELPCTNCGYCTKVCPVRINPLKNLNKCIKCGLCNYVCPSKINIIKEENNE